MKPERAQRLTRLIDAEPVWLDSGGPGITDATGAPVPRRRGVAILFACPIHGDECLVAVSVDPPLDGGPPTAGEKAWKRTGSEDFATVTLSPSIRVLGGPTGCEWHGFIRNGLFEHCGDAR